jgi:ferrous iron transport protein B
LLNKVLKGETPELFVEIPLYQLPKAYVLLKKLYVRLKEFFLEAVPMIFIGIALINLLDLLGVVRWLTLMIGPFLTNILGLPKEMAVVMVSGFLRKDVFIALLTPFHLPIKQLIIASVVLVIYLPCLATLTMLLKEFKAKEGFTLIASLFMAAIAIGFMLNFLIP